MVEPRGMDLLAATPRGTRDDDAANAAATGPADRALAEEVQQHSTSALMDGASSSVPPRPMMMPPPPPPPPPDRSPPKNGGTGGLKPGKNNDEATKSVASTKKSVRSGRTHCTSAADATNTSAAMRTAATTGEETDGDQQGSFRHRHVGGVTDEGLRHFYDAMSLVDPDTRQGWTQAQTCCPPSVLLHECCPCYFLRACQFNPWEAARRMCRYWTERITLFQERAFEAMTIGTDAVPPTGLSREDVKLLETGTFLALPRERAGKSVLFVDEDRLEPHMLDRAASRLRVLWYVLHACFTSGGGGDQAHRLVVLFACYKPPSGGQYGASTWQFSSGSVKFPLVLPIVMDSIHLLTLQTKTGTGTLIHVILAATAAMLGSYLSSLTKVHHGTAKRGQYATPLEEEARAKETLRQKMMEIGFTAKGLPDWAGGSFGPQDFVGWARRRRRHEQRVFWTSEQRMLQRRDVNKVHSRQKRRRRHEELHDLQTQITQLAQENDRAGRVNASLENLVAMATNTVSQLESFPPASMNPTVDLTCEPRPLPGVPVESFDHLAFMASLEPDPIAPSCTPAGFASARTPVSSLPVSFGPLALNSAELPSDQMPRSVSAFPGPDFNDGAATYLPDRPPLNVDDLTTNTAWQNQASTRSSARELASLQPFSFADLCPTQPVAIDAVAMPSGLVSSSLFSTYGVPQPVAAPAFGSHELSNQVDMPTPNPALAFLLNAMLQHQQTVQLPPSSTAAETHAIPSGRLNVGLDTLVPAPIEDLHVRSEIHPSLGSRNRNQSPNGNGRNDTTLLFDLDWT